MLNAELLYSLLFIVATRGQNPGILGMLLEKDRKMHLFVRKSNKTAFSEQAHGHSLHFSTVCLVCSPLCIHHCNRSPKLAASS